MYKPVNGFECIKNMPPDSVYSNQDFQLAIRVLNKGAYDINKGIINVTGDPGYITFDRRISDSSTRRNLKGQSNYDPREKEEIINFDTDVTFVDKGF